MARISYLKCLRCLLFHVPITVNKYKNQINPVGCFKIFGYFHLTCLLWRLFFYSVKESFIKHSYQDKQLFRVATKTSTTPSICDLRDPKRGVLRLPVGVGALSSVRLFYGSCLAVGDGTSGSLPWLAPMVLTSHIPLQPFFHLTVCWDTQAHGNLELEQSCSFLTARSLFHLSRLKLAPLF